MPDNPTPADTRPIALPGHAVLALTGADALKFAQAQFMNDVAALGDGEWQWNGWLNAKGRLIALFALLRLDAQTLWLLLPDHAPAELADALKKYVFRSKLVLAVRDDLRVEGHFDAASRPDAGMAERRGDDAIALAWPGGRRIDIHPASPSGAASTDPASELRWRQADLRAGIPRLADSQSAQWTPQQLSLDSLRAYSVKKGCYPGQEIVARTHFLGQAKRGLRLLETAAEVAPGSEVGDGERVIGTVIASAGQLSLAVTALDAEPRIAGGQPAHALDFAG